MARHRFFLTAPLAGGALPLSPADLRHASLVARLRVGEEVVAVEPGGRELVVRLSAVSRDRVSGEVVESLPPRPPLPRVVLVQAVAKGERMDLVVRMATEIGVAAVVPVLSVRTVVRMDARKRRERAERWRAVAAEAAKQSQRLDIPEVLEPVRLSDLRERPGGAGSVLVAWEAAAGTSTVREAVRKLGRSAADGVAIVVGPEGGLAEAEVEALVERGAVPVSLGPTLLRTETAGAVASALVLQEMLEAVRSGA